MPMPVLFSKKWISTALSSDYIRSKIPNLELNGRSNREHRAATDAAHLPSDIKMIFTADTLYDQQLSKLGFQLRDARENW